MQTPQLFSLTDEVALVTGAGSGIGQQIARGFAEAGADVACLDRRKDGGIEETVRAVEAAGQRALPLAVDVTDREALYEAVGQTEKELGPLSLALNAAGIANAAPAEEMPTEQWQQMIDINYTGLFHSCQAEGRAMLRHGRGAIVNIASMSGVIVNRGLEQVHYNSAKAAVIHLTKSLAMEWAEHGIRVNAISPGYTATPMNTRPEMAHQTQAFEEQTPLQRMARVEEMIGPAVFLASPAASFCTGVNLLVDGGFCCW